jgi:hypothetical protein
LARGVVVGVGVVEGVAEVEAEAEAEAEVVVEAEVEAEAGVEVEAEAGVEVEAEKNSTTKNVSSTQKKHTKWAIPFGYDTKTTQNFMVLLSNTFTIAGPNSSLINVCTMFCISMD